MGTIIVAAIVFGIIGFAVFSMIKNRNKGCNCGCEGCARSEKCHK